MLIMRAVLSIVWAVACSAFMSVEPTRGLYVDEDGRVRIFHGLNAVYKLSPWHPEFTGYDPKYSLSETDMQNLQDWGFNVLRVGVMWDGTEPASKTAPGVYNFTYLDAMKDFVNRLGSYGIYSILDMHEDSLSRFYCGEGIPDAYIQPNATNFTFPFPVPVTFERNSMGYPNLTECQAVNFAIYLFTVSEQHSWGQSYNSTAFATAFSHFWHAVARTFNASEAVLGYELINEPQAGDLYANLLDYIIPGQADKQNIFPLYLNAYNAVRTADAQHIVFFEHAVTEPYFFQQSGFPYGGIGGVSQLDKQALSFHLYCINQNATGDITNVTACAENLELYWPLERQNKATIGGGSFLSEFGAVGPHAASADALTVMSELADSDLESWTYWSYKNFQDITTQNPATETLYNADGSLQLLKLKALSRTYAQVIAGTPTSINMSFNATTAAFLLSYDVNTAIPLPARFTTIYYNGPLHYPSGIQYALSPTTCGTVAKTHSTLTIAHAAGCAGAVTFQASAI